MGIDKSKTSMENCDNLPFFAPLVGGERPRSLGSMLGGADTARLAGRYPNGGYGSHRRGGNTVTRKPCYSKPARV